MIDGFRPSLVPPSEAWKLTIRLVSNPIDPMHATINMRLTVSIAQDKTVSAATFAEALAGAVDSIDRHLHRGAYSTALVQGRQIVTWTKRHAEYTWYICRS